MKFGSADEVRCLFMGLWFIYPWNSLLFEFFCFFAFFHPSKSKILRKITKIGGKQTNYTYSGRSAQGDTFSSPKCKKIFRNDKDMFLQKSGPKGGGNGQWNCKFFLRPFKSESYTRFHKAQAPCSTLLTFLLLFYSVPTRKKLF